MFKVWNAAKKVKVLFEKEIDSWDVKYRDVESIKNSLSWDIHAKIKDQILEGSKLEIDDAVKNLVHEILEDPEFKTGLKDIVRDAMRERFKQYLGKL